MTQLFFPCDEKYFTGIWPEVVSITWNLQNSQSDLDSFLRGHRFPSLQTFRVDERNISNLDVLASYQTLSVLHCSGNRITSLPGLPNLRKLVCRANLLTSIPDSPILEYLDCSYNKITTYHFPHRNSYKKLVITGNQLSGDLVIECPSMTYLDVSKNQISSLLLKCPTLTDLFCYENKIRTTNGFSRCVMLQHITCTQNPLEDLNGLENCPELRMVYACNKLAPPVPGKYFLVV
jgi:Leucine-rich repeat (LRR) protein